jgi:hypothetical protein
MKRPLDACAVVAGELADTARDVVKVLSGYERIVKVESVRRVSRFRLTAKIENHFDKRFHAPGASESFADRLGLDGQHQVEVVG